MPDRGCPGKHHLSRRSMATKAKPSWSQGQADPVIIHDDVFYHFFEQLLLLRHRERLPFRNQQLESRVARTAALGGRGIVLRPPFRVPQLFFNLEALVCEVETLSLELIAVAFACGGAFEVAAHAAVDLAKAVLE